MRIAYAGVVGIALLSACASAHRGGQSAKAIPILTRSEVSANCGTQFIGNVSVERTIPIGTPVTMAEFATELGRKAKAEGADAVLNAKFVNQTPQRDDHPETMARYVAYGTMVRYLDDACSS